MTLISALGMMICTILPWVQISGLQADETFKMIHISGFSTHFGVVGGLLAAGISFLAYRQKNTSIAILAAVAFIWPVIASYRFLPDISTAESLLLILDTIKKTPAWGLGLYMFLAMVTGVSALYNANRKEEDSAKSGWSHKQFKRAAQLYGIGLVFFLFQYGFPQRPTCEDGTQIILD